jgi:hypothetical protein
MPSHNAPRKPATMMLMTALKVKPCACSTLLRHRRKCWKSERSSRRSSYLYSKGSKHCGNGTIDHGIDIAVMDPLLFAKRLGHNRADGIFVDVSHGVTPA